MKRQRAEETEEGKGQSLAVYLKKQDAGMLFVQFAQLSTF